MVVLSVGMEISESVRELGKNLDVELDEYGFCQTTQINPLETSRPGIYAVGPFREPKDIPEAVIDGESGDLIEAFQTGTYEQGPAAVPGVPEPNAMTLAALGALAVAGLTRRGSRRSS